MKRLAWSEVRSARQPGLKQELRVLIELLRVLPRPGFPMQLTILPSNIMVGTDGSVLVGAARLGGAEHQERYLSPEVQAGAEPKLPAAIYTVGALLFEAVTGHRFEGRDRVTQELAGARAMARAAGLGARFWEIYLLEAAAKATDERPDARWSSGFDFAEDLERVAKERIVSRDELGELVGEVLDTRRSSRPPAAGLSGPAKAGPPPLPRRGRRRSSQSKLKKASKPNMAKVAAPKPAASAGPPLPRSDGDAPQLPLITSLRVPSRLKLPEGVAPAGAAKDRRATAPASSPTEPAADWSSSVVAPNEDGAPPSNAETSAERSVTSAPSGANAASAAPGARRSGAPSVVVRAGTASGLRAAVGPPATTPPIGSMTQPGAAGAPHADAFPHTGTLPGPMVAPEPAGAEGAEFAEQEDPTIPRHRTLPGEFAEHEDPTIPRHRTLQGPGDLRTFEEQFRIANERASAPDPSRHGTLVGLGQPAEVVAASAPPSGPVAPSKPEARANGSAGAEAPKAAGQKGVEASAPASSAPPSSSSPTPSSAGQRFIFSPAPDPEWDSELPPSDAAQSGSSVTTHPPNKSWFGKAALSLLLMVALALGTLEYYGHVVTRTFAGAPPKASEPKQDEPRDTAPLDDADGLAMDVASSSDVSEAESKPPNDESIEVSPADEPANEDDAASESTEEPTPAAAAPSGSSEASPAKGPTPPRRAPVRRKARSAERDYGI